MGSHKVTAANDKDIKFIFQFKTNFKMLSPMVKDTVFHMGIFFSEE